MGSLAQAKTLGGVGSIMGILAVIPYVGPIIAIVGGILVLIAVKYISDEVGDISIFNNMLIAVILVIVGLAVAAVTFFIGVFSIFDIPGLIQGKVDPSAFTGPELLPRILLMLLLPLAVIWVFFIISAVFQRRSYNTIASSLNVGLFSTAALIYLIGAALSIILVGFIIMFVAGIIEVVAFFSIPDQTSQPVRRICVNCGRQVGWDAEFCEHCGKQLG